MNDTATPTAASATEFRCPRRDEYAAGQHRDTAGTDTWTDTPSMAGGIGPCCSHCGSIQPDTFLAKVRDSWIVAPCDKAWKCYLDKPYDADEIKHIKTSSLAWRTVRKLKLEEGLDLSEATAVADTYWADNEAPGITGRTVAKLYYTHLDKAQKTEFVQLHRSGQMQLAWPGRFYVTPCFTTRAELGS